MGGSSSRRSGMPKPRKLENTCDLTIHTQLKSPIEEIISTLREGDILDIAIFPPDDCVALSNGKIAGKIVCFELKELLDCIKLGNEYYGIIKNINGIRCSITIRQIK